MRFGQLFLTLMQTCPDGGAVVTSLLLQLGRPGQGLQWVALAMEISALINIACSYCFRRHARQREEVISGRKVWEPHLRPHVWYRVWIVVAGQFHPMYPRARAGLEIQSRDEPFAGVLVHAVRKHGNVGEY